MATDTRREPRPSRSRPQNPQRGSGKPGLDARMAAARLLGAVIDTRTPLDALTDGEHGHPQYRALDSRDRSLVKAILSTALRNRVAIERMIAERLDRPLPEKARGLSHILHVALAQIVYLDLPDSAAVDLAVSHAREDPRSVRFAGLVNGLLREILRGRESGAIAPRPVDVAEGPDWLRERLVATYGARRANLILAAHRVEPSVDFTVRSDPDRWAGELGGVVLPTGTVRVETLAGPVPELPGFTDGHWWVQDAAAALPARLLGDVSGLTVADLCAAPGGKTAQLAAAGARVTAVDASRNRLVRLRSNLDRLGLSAEVVEADLTAEERPILGNGRFDAVLLDVPCSSTGTIRRHPDIAWTKTPEDIERLAALQLRLLARAAAMVRPGGLLVYSNCSLDLAEGEDLVERFLAGSRDLVPDPIRPDELPGIAEFVTPGGRLRTTPEQLAMPTPRLSGLDGFFAARFRRS